MVEEVYYIADMIVSHNHMIPPVSIGNVKLSSSPISKGRPGSERLSILDIQSQTSSSPIASTTAPTTPNTEAVIQSLIGLPSTSVSLDCALRNRHDPNLSPVHHIRSRFPPQASPQPPSTFLPFHHHQVPMQNPVTQAARNPARDFLRANGIPRMGT